MESIAKRHLVAAALSTLAGLAALEGPPQEVVSWCQEVSAPYLFIPGDTTPVDGWTSIAPTGGTPGRWLLGDDRIAIESIDDGVSDDWVRLNAAMASCAYKAEIHFRSGNWRCNTTGEVPSGSVLRGQPGVFINATMVAGPFTNFVFKRFPTLSGAGTISVQSTVGSPNVTTLDATIVIGDWVWLGQGAATPFLVQQFQVIDRVGNVLTLDRDVEFVFPAGTPLRHIDEQVRDITIDGGWMTVTGTGDRIVEFIGPYNVEISKILAPEADFVVLGSLDIGGLQAKMSDMRGSFGAVASTAWLLESGDRCGLYRMSADRATNAVTVFDSVNFSVEDVDGSECSNAGLVITSNGMAFGCNKFEIRRGGFNGSPNVGVALGFATNGTLVGVRSDSNLVNFDVGSGGAPSNIKLLGCSSARAGLYGVQVRAVAVGTRLSGHQSTSDLRGIAVFGPVDIYESDIIEYTGTGILVDGAIAVRTPVHVSGGRIASAVSGSVGSDINGPAVMTFENVKFECNTLAANSSAIFHRATAVGVVILRNNIGTQASACNGYVDFGGGNTLRIEGRNDFDTFTGPYIINAAGFVNDFNVTLNGTTPVVVPWPDLKQRETPKLTRVSVSGGTGQAPVLVTNPGVGFTLTGQSIGDNDVYNVGISR